MVHPTVLMGSAASVLPFLLIVAVALYGVAIFVLVRRRRGTEGGSALPYILLIAAFFLVTFSSMTMTSSVADDPGALCGGSAFAAADAPVDATANANGQTCRVLGESSVHFAYVLLGIAGVLTLAVILDPRRPPAVD